MAERRREFGAKSDCCCKSCRGIACSLPGAFCLEQQIFRVPSIFECRKREESLIIKSTAKTGMFWGNVFLSREILVYVETIKSFFQYTRITSAYQAEEMQNARTFYSGVYYTVHPHDRESITVRPASSFIARANSPPAIGCIYRLWSLGCATTAVRDRCETTRPYLV